MNWMMLPSPFVKRDLLSECRRYQVGDAKCQYYQKDDSDTFCFSFHDKLTISNKTFLLQQFTHLHLEFLGFFTSANSKVAAIGSIDNPSR